jgi:hypothetical protein
MARFSFSAKSAYESWLWGDHRDFDLHFARDPDGYFYVSGDESKEWPASFYDGRTDEHTNEELTRLAPKGAEKLYSAFKDIMSPASAHSDHRGVLNRASANTSAGPTACQPLATADSARSG